METTFLLTGHRPTGELDEIIGTFDTSASAKAFVSDVVGAVVEWKEPGTGLWIGGRWHIESLPHNTSTKSEFNAWEPSA